MRVGIIGANGKLGTLVTQECVERGHDVVAIVRSGECGTKGVKNVLKKDLFELEKEDVKDCDLIISTFGGGLNNPPEINRKAIGRLSDIVQNTETYLVVVGGAGTLFTDHLHTQRVYETKEHPDFLREISRNICLGYLEMKEKPNVNYTFVCPSLFFDFEGQKKGIYQVGTEEEVIFSSKHESRISYRDFARALADEGEDRRYKGKCITICEV